MAIKWQQRDIFGNGINFYPDCIIVNILVVILQYSFEKNYYGETE